MSVPRRGTLPWRAILALMVPAVMAPAELVARQAPVRPPAASSAGCERCHGELELLRQQSGNLTRAQNLLVPEHVVAGSAHAGMACAECHTGYSRYPHPEPATRTATCASCHQPADTLWQRSMHASADDPVTCVQCHGSHDIRSAAELAAPEGVHGANAPCASCHQSSRIEAHRPHAEGVMCASCHAPHDTRAVDDRESWLAPGRQQQTCGTCHDSVAVRWRTDIHGDARLREAHLAGRQPLADVIVCTSCHTGHRMVGRDDPAFMLESVERCATCHEKASSTFYNSYHGRATALGSRVSATCADCHGAHTVLPDTFPASHVAEANLVQTCAACHPHARPAFVKYDSHPDPFNRARNPWIFYSFFLMNGLLVFVLVVFGGHTLLWWLRLWLDKRRGIIHGIGVHHDPGHAGDQP
ncbi:MAG TPA: cytochrome c3 family protein [Longimicrobiales bacterium]|nr:cytochrome c3 family protein [Longimicrobiales bacterium]